MSSKGKPGKTKTRTRGASKDRQPAFPAPCSNPAGRKTDILNIGKEGRPEYTLLERQVETARMYALGYSQQEIGEHLGVSQTTIHKDLVSIRARWIEMANVSLGERKALELDRIDWIERQAQEQWEKSKRRAEQVKTTVEKVLMPAPTVVNGRIKGGNNSDPKNGGKFRVGTPLPNLKMEPVRKYVERVTRGQTGDVRFLQQIAWCIEARLKIFGVLEERKGDVNIVNLDWSQLESRVRSQSPDAVEQRLLREASGQEEPINESSKEGA